MSLLSTSNKPTTISNNKKTRQPQQRITPILPPLYKPSIIIQNIKRIIGNFPILDTNFLGTSDLSNDILQLDTFLNFQMFFYIRFNGPHMF